ncbi:uncharacterized protein PFL1_04453 [Pseudozyma flocculosa PF-1]|uniref:ditrans,polycis-polyprenyl diphosphate synthase [(2E,6E)-farnesyldiphosphate specific] n=1 Tax=Pseudozyma flocculosa PF-1 TaxID=1277687 RepID=A0A061HBY9_9BASI|nr:uncharacterized protein PFL1_04453 [Pseudozyma flocculosa PF-1]EPQ28126.1 hypothetical protein PFL1_04453 [Pseudozyma flocculosa PF-1]
MHKRYRAPATAGPISPLLPLQALAFGLIHLVYHLVLAASQLINAAQSLTARSSAAHQSSSARAAVAAGAAFPGKLPRHLAVILAPPEPATWPAIYTAYLVDPLARIFLPDRATGQHLEKGRQASAPSTAHTTAADLVQLIRLSSEAGIPTLTVYSPTPLSTETLVAAENLLRQSGCRLEGDQCSAAPGIDQAAPSTSTPGRRRRRQASSSSSGASDDGETSTAGTSKSEDETLASSNTSVMGDVPDEAAKGGDAKGAAGLTVRLVTTGVGRMQRHREAHAAPTGGASIDVVLLSHDDGKLEMARSATEWARQVGREYLHKLREVAAADGTGDEEGARALRKRMVATLTPGDLDEYLLRQGTISEPDFLIVQGAPPRMRKLYGFPPWPIRLTEL